MLKIGCHLSISEGFYKAANTILEMGGNSFQYFSRNPRGGAAKEFNMDDFNKFMSIGANLNLLCHAPYTVNLCSSKIEVRDFARQMILEDLKIMGNFKNGLYNIHPGSHTSQGINVGINQIIESLNNVIDKDQSTTILLETMSGKGSEIGSNLNELKCIIDGITYKDKVGVCLDTCHMYSAGYDIVNFLDEVIMEFDNIIGLDKLKAIHLNDSKTPFNSRLDCHEKIGFGTIGLGPIIKIINHPKLQNIPFFLETPNENDGFKMEISLLKNKCNNN